MEILSHPTVIANPAYIPRKALDQRPPSGLLFKSAGPKRPSPYPVVIANPQAFHTFGSTVIRHINVELQGGGIISRAIV